MKLLNEKLIMENWSPVIEKLGVTDQSKKEWMAKYAHFHSMNESNAFPSADIGNVPGMGNPMTPTAGNGANAFYSNAPGSGDKFPSLLPISLQVAKRTVGFDIVPVIPMNGPTGVLTYLDYVYAGGREPGKAAANGPAGGEDGFVIQFSTTDLTEDEAKEITVLTEAVAADTSAVDKLDVAYIGKHPLSGNYVYRVFKSSALQVQTIVGDTKKVYGNTTAAPTVTADLGTFTSKGSFVSLDEMQVQGYAGAGLTDADAWYGGKVDGSKNPETMSRGVGETTHFRPIGLETFTKFVEAGTYQASAIVTTEQIQDLNRQYGFDVVGMIENKLVDEIAKSTNYHILSRAFALGWDNHIGFNASDGVNLNMTYGAAATTASYIDKTGSVKSMVVPKVDTSGSYENQSTLQRRVFGNILAAGNVVAQRGNRGSANFIVTNLQMATIIQDNAQFQAAPMSNTVNQNNGTLYPVGSIAGMNLFVDPNMGWSDTRILVGRKGADEDPGLKYMPYMIAESIKTIAEGTMSPKIAVKSRYALVEAGFHPETQYLTIYINTAGKLIGAGA